MGTAPFRDDSHPCHFSAVGLLFLAESFLKIQLHAISEVGAQRDRDETVAGGVRATLVLLSKSILRFVVVCSSRIADAARLLGGRFLGFGCSSRN